MIQVIYIMAALYGVAAILGTLPPIPYMFQSASLLSCVWLLSSYQHNNVKRLPAWTNFMFCTVSVLLLPLDWTHVPTGVWLFTVATTLAFAAGFAARDENKPC